MDRDQRAVGAVLGDALVARSSSASLWNRAAIVHFEHTKRAAGSGSLMRRMRTSPN